MFGLLGLACAYIIIGLALVPRLDPAQPKFDFRAFFASIAWSFVWPVKVWTWFKNRNK